MNGATLRGLLLDAWHQVLDNRVFRVVGVLAALTVLMTFAVAIRDDGIVLGWKHFSYPQLGLDELGDSAGGSNNFEGLAREIVKALQGLIVDQLVGVFGVLFCIAAAAFFVPRMLERGAADTIFSKPVSRTMLLLTRYLAGLLLVGVLSAVLVFGMHLGFSLRSGHSETSFLWSLPVLIYRFGLLFSVTVLVGVLTRSSLAAVLVSLLFTGFNGCVHATWEASHAFDEYKQRTATRSADEEPRKPHPVIRAMRLTHDGLHFALPKPGDAPRLLELIRDGEHPAEPARRSPFAPQPGTEGPQPEKLAWRGPWYRNAWVSLATSLGFALLMLVWAAVHLGRIRF